MKFRMSLLSLLVLFSTAARAGDHYTQILNLSDWTHISGMGRYRVEFDVNYAPPTELRVFEETFDEDETHPQITVKRLGITGAPLIEVKTEIDQIDVDGKKIRHIHSAVNQFNYSVQPVPKESDPVEIFVGDLIPKVIALPIENNTYLLTVRGTVSDSFLIQPLGNDQFKFIRRTQTKPQNLVTVFTLAAKGLSYDFSALIPPGVLDSTDRQCSHPKESRQLRDIEIDGHIVKRIEYCYPIGKSFERIVLFVNKPATSPFDELALRKMLQGNGEMATSPLLNISDRPLSEMNCHGYSLKAITGASLNLPAGATWIEGLTTSFGVEGTNPFATLLKAHFKKIKEAYQYGEAKLSADPDIKNGDLVVFKRGPDDARHSAVVIGHKNSQLWLQHKLEEGPVVNTPLGNIANIYDYHEIEVYRFLGR